MVKNLVRTNVIRLLPMNTADMAHMRIYASVTRPLGGPGDKVASYPGLSVFVLRSLVCVQYNTRKRKSSEILHHSSASVYCTEHKTHKTKNKKQERPGYSSYAPPVFSCSFFIPSPLLSPFPIVASPLFQ